MNGEIRGWSNMWAPNSNMGNDFSAAIPFSLANCQSLLLSVSLHEIHTQHLQQRPCRWLSLTVHDTCDDVTHDEKWKSIRFCIINFSGSGGNSSREISLIIEIGNFYPSPNIACCICMPFCCLFILRVRGRRVSKLWISHGVTPCLSPSLCIRLRIDYYVLNWYFSHATNNHSFRHNQIVSKISSRN